MKRLLTTAAAVAAVTLAPGVAAAQDASATPAISLVHGIPGTTVDLVVDGTVVIDDFVPGSIADITSFAGRTLADVEVVDSDGGETIIGPIDSLIVPNSGNWSIVAHLDAAGVATLTSFENNVTPTDNGSARVTLRHVAEVGPVDLVLGDQRPITALANGSSQELTLPDGTLADAQLAPTGEAPVKEIANLDLAANTNTILYAVGSAEDDTIDVVVQIIELPVDAPPATTSTTTTTTTTPTPSAVNTGSPIDGSPTSLALIALAGGLLLAGGSLVARRRV